ncbi:MAG: MGMT family protein [Candidatus Pacebacteria bacterium]|nr:MGMT family protein [Candidatus Paceibacterota bacterium]
MTLCSTPCVTVFQKRVYEAVSQVPVGRVTTYKLLGEHIGCGCYRAVGQALRRNPWAPHVPCHRVIASDGTLGGFAGGRDGAEIERKQKLLASEGVEFSDGTLVDPARIFRFESE